MSARLRRVEGRRWGQIILRMCLESQAVLALVDLAEVRGGRIVLAGLSVKQETCAFLSTFRPQSIARTIHVVLVCRIPTWNDINGTGRVPIHEISPSCYV